MSKENTWLKVHFMTNKLPYLMQNKQILLLLLPRKTQSFANKVTKKTILQYLIVNEFTKGVYQDTL